MRYSGDSHCMCLVLRIVIKSIIGHKSRDLCPGYMNKLFIFV